MALLNNADLRQEAFAIGIAHGQVLTVDDHLAAVEEFDLIAVDDV